MRRVLLVADLEGISGVDDVEPLVLGAPGYARAAKRMTEEVALVARLLLEHGVEHVRISDAHHSGADGNIDAAGLPSGCELLFDTHDMYAGALLDDVDVVACVGMHALGDSPGFGAHTVSVNTAWTLGGEALTETRIVQLLAAERGVPMWFSAGDDVLRSQAPRGVGFVQTKRSISRGESVSAAPADIERAFRSVLKQPPLKVSALPVAPLLVRFQKQAEAEAATGGVRRSPTERELPAFDTFHAQFLAACRMIESASDALFSRVKARNAARLLLDGWD